MSVADLLMLAPWLIFIASLALIGYRLSHRRGTFHRHRRRVR